MKRDHLRESHVPFSLIVSRHEEEMSIPNTEYSLMSDFKKSFCKKYASKANQPVFSSCMSPPVCCGRLETDQEWLPSVRSASLSHVLCRASSMGRLSKKTWTQSHQAPSGTQMSKGVYLIWGGHFFSIFCNYQLQLFPMLQLSLWAKNSGTKLYENRNTFQNETVHDAEF